MTTAAGRAIGHTLRMRRPEPLPAALAVDAFTLAEADELAVSRGRMRNRQLIRVSRGIRATGTDGPVVPDGHVGAFTRITHLSAASHWTAGAVWKLSHYTCQGEQTMLHISRPEDKAAPRRRKVIGHRSKLYEDEVTTVNGIRVTTRERTWLDLAETLTVDELVVIADHLIRVPRFRFEGRDTPFCTTTDLQAMIDRHPGKRGVRKARAALELSRVGADSPPETLLRLALERAGLPEPILNRPIIDDRGVPHHEPDIAYPEFRVGVGVEYEGGGHSDGDQVDRDITRAERYRQLGWLEVRISKRHMRDDARAAVVKVRAALITRGWRPQPPSAAQ